MPLALHATDLRKRLGPHAALDGVTVDFTAGGLHGLIGSDGAGKTTLLRTLVGLLRPDAGAVQYRDGARSLSLEEARPGLAYMPQQQSLYGDLSISEHLDFFRDLYGIPPSIYRDRRARLLGLTRLDKFQDRPAGKLSGGMYKKLGLMCALLRTPTALLLDEPTNGVDPISRREFWDLLHDLRREGLLIIVATAYMDEAERCAHVHLMENGRVLAAGAPRDLLSREGVRGFSEYFIRRAEGAGPIGRSR